MTPIERLKELHEKATPGPWRKNEYGGVQAAHSVGSFDKITLEGFALCGSQESGDNRDLLLAMRNLLPELIALWEAVNEWSASWEGSEEDEALVMAKIALNARAEEVLK